MRSKLDIELKSEKSDGKSLEQSTSVSVHKLRNNKLTLGPDLVVEEPSSYSMMQSSSYRKRFSIPEEADDDFLKNYAAEALSSELGIDNSAVLLDHLQIREVPSGTFLMKEESNVVSILIRKNVIIMFLKLS